MNCVVRPATPPGSATGSGGAQSLLLAKGSLEKRDEDIQLSTCRRCRVPDHILYVVVWEQPGHILYVVVWEQPDHILYVVVWEQPGHILYVVVWEKPEPYVRYSDSPCK